MSGLLCVCEQESEQCGGWRGCRARGCCVCVSERGSSVVGGEDVGAVVCVCERESEQCGGWRGCRGCCVCVSERVSSVVGGEDVRAVVCV